MNALILVPTYNERENLPILVGGVLAHPARASSCSTTAHQDGTGQIADELARQYPGRLDVMHRTGQRGLGRSYRDGFRAAIASDADVVCQMDADLSHDPEVPAVADRGHGGRGSGHRLALHPRRRGRELAIPPRDVERFRQHLHPHRHRLADPRLHERLSLLAARRAGADPARPDHLRRLLVSRRSRLSRGRGRLAHRRIGRSCSSNAGWARRSCRAAC